MAAGSWTRPRVPSHFHISLEPADAQGEETLVFRSERRKIKLKGRFFREFAEKVLPLINGEHTVAEIREGAAGVFTPESVDTALELLAQNNLLEEPSEQARIPQHNFLLELGGLADDAEKRLGNTTVTIVGASGAAAHAALSLTAAGIGKLRVVDALPVSASDTYLSPVYSRGDIGQPRVGILGAKFADVVQGLNDPLASDDAVADVIRESNLVVCCPDAGLASLFYRVNRACHAAGIPWISASVSGFEAILGPTVIPGSTACYLCYKMRAVACAENPEEEFAFEKSLDERKQDWSGQRENTVFATGAAGHLLGLEAMKLLTGAMPPGLAGTVAILDFVQLTLTRHKVLRKPWCPVCYGK